MQTNSANLNPQLSKTKKLELSKEKYADPEKKASYFGEWEPHELSQWAAITKLAYSLDFILVQFCIWAESRLWVANNNGKS